MPLRNPEHLLPLRPETVLPLLSGNRLLRETVILPSVDSTHLEARRRVETGKARHGLVLCAEEQTAGCGRHGRSWWSPPRTNLYLSVVLRNPFPPQDLFLATAAAASAVRHTLRGLCRLAADLKWPNDVMVRRRKIAGVLAETLDGFLLLGIGLNVNCDPSTSTDLRSTATSLLRETGRSWDRATLLASLLKDLEERYLAYPEGRDRLFREWETGLVWPRSPVLLPTPDGPLRGRLVGVADDGRALLQTPSGTFAVSVETWTLHRGHKNPTV